VKEIEEHVATMETIIYDEKTPMSTSPVNPMEFLKELKGPPAEEKASSTPFANEKQASVKVSPPKLDFRLIWRRVRRAFFHLIRFCLRREARIISSVTHTSFGIHHMARARRLVTSVARVLATKPEVLTGIRKRLLIPDGLAAGDDTELVIYFGDVQGQPKQNKGTLYGIWIDHHAADHVLALQQSLTHFERVLSEWRPTYLQMLRSNFVKTRVKIDSNIFTLTLVHVVSLPPQVLAGMSTLFVYLCTGQHAECL
jgi:magnesium transporter